MAQKQHTETMCDECRNIGSRVDSLAVVTCEVHQVDLCAHHMRKHFVEQNSTCRLIPAALNERFTDHRMDA